MTKEEDSLYRKWNYIKNDLDMEEKLTMHLKTEKVREMRSPLIHNE